MDKVYQVEVLNERDEMLELIKVVGDDSLNRLRRILSPYGLTVEQVD
jgi:hypothetical protein